MLNLLFAISILGAGVLAALGIGYVTALLLKAFFKEDELGIDD